MNMRLCAFASLLTFCIAGQADAQLNIGGILNKPIGKIINPIGDGGSQLIGGIKKSIEYAPGALVPGAKIPGNILDGKGLGLAPGMQLPKFLNPGGQPQNLPGVSGQWIGGQPPLPYPQPKQTFPMPNSGLVPGSGSLPGQVILPAQGQATIGQSYPTPVQAYAVPQQTYPVPQQTYPAPQQTYPAPQQNYPAPQQNYYAPAQSYSAPVSQGNIQYSQPSNTTRRIRPAQPIRRVLGNPFRR